MKGYWIALYKKVHSIKNLKSYAAKATKIIQNYGGTALVRGGKFQVLEGDNFPRTVVWEFPSYKMAMECHSSKEYKEAWSLAQETTERNLQIVEGT